MYISFKGSEQIGSNSDPKYRIKIKLFKSSPNPIITFILLIENNGELSEFMQEYNQCIADNDNLEIIDGLERIVL